MYLKKKPTIVSKKLVPVSKTSALSRKSITVCPSEQVSESNETVSSSKYPRLCAATLRVTLGVISFYVFLFEIKPLIYFKLTANLIIIIQMSSKGFLNFKRARYNELLASFMYIEWCSIFMCAAL